MHNQSLPSPCRVCSSLHSYHFLDTTLPRKIELFKEAFPAQGEKNRESKSFHSTLTRHRHDQEDLLKQTLLNL